MRRHSMGTTGKAWLAAATAASLALLPACSMPWEAPAGSDEPQYEVEDESGEGQGNKVVYSSDTYKEEETGEELEFSYRIAMLAGYWTGNPDPASFSYRAVYVLEAPQKGFSYVLEGRLPDGRSVTLNREADQPDWRVRKLEDTFTPAAETESKSDAPKGTEASAPGTTDAGASGPAGGAVMTGADARGAKPWQAGDEQGQPEGEEQQDAGQVEAKPEDGDSLVSSAGTVRRDEPEQPKNGPAEGEEKEEKQEDDKSASAAKSASRRVNDGSGATMMQQVFIVESTKPFEASQMSFSFSEMMRWTEKMDPIFAKLSDPAELTFNNTVTDASGQGIHGSLVKANGSWLWVRRGEETSGGNLPRDTSPGAGAEVRGYETYRLTALSRLAHEAEGIPLSDPAAVARLWDTTLKGCSFMLARGSDSGVALPVPNKKGVEAFADVTIGTDEYGTALNVSIGLKGPDTSLTQEVYDEYVGRRGTRNAKAYCAVMGCDGKSLVIG